MTNSIHDMGGMHGFGPVEPEPNEPVFHADWEKRVLANRVSMGFTGLWTIDGGRAFLENLPPRAYLVSYYERWFSGLERSVVEHGLVGEDEIEAGHSLRPGRGLNRKLSLDIAKNWRGPMASFERPSPAPARFKAGDHVRTRNINPLTHTRLPRYARDKSGTVEAIRGCHVFPDSAAIGAGDNPQWLYTVVFSARELWGEEADPTVSVSIEAFEPYLAPGVSAMSRTQEDAVPGLTAALPSLPRDADGPVFREPWEAQAFAMTLALYRRGLFSWPEWAAALGSEIKRAQAAGDPDTGDTYYHHWLAALERLVAEKNIADRASLARYRDAWDRAADRTPHGTPIELRPEDFS